MNAHPSSPQHLDWLDVPPPLEHLPLLQGRSCSPLLDLPLLIVDENGKFKLTTIHDCRIVAPPLTSWPRPVSGSAPKHDNHMTSQSGSCRDCKQAVPYVHLCATKGVQLINKGTNVRLGHI